MLKNNQKQPVEHSIEKPILLNFADLCAICFARFSEETYSYLSQPILLELTLSANFSISKSPFDLKTDI